MGRQILSDWHTETFKALVSNMSVAWNNRIGDY